MFASDPPEFTPLSPLHTQTALLKQQRKRLRKLQAAVAAARGILSEFPVSSTPLNPFGRSVQAALRRISEATQRSNPHCTPQALQFCELAIIAAISSMQNPAATAAAAGEDKQQQQQLQEQPSLIDADIDDHAMAQALDATVTPAASSADPPVDPPVTDSEPAQQLQETGGDSPQKKEEEEEESAQQPKTGGDFPQKKEEEEEENGQSEQSQEGGAAQPASLETAVPAAAAAQPASSQAELISIAAIGELLEHMWAMSDHVIREGEAFEPQLPGSLVSEFQPEKSKYKFPLSLLWLYDEQQHKKRNSNQSIAIWQKEMPLLPFWTLGVPGDGDCLFHSSFLSDFAFTPNVNDAAAIRALADATTDAKDDSMGVDAKSAAFALQSVSKEQPELHKNASPG